MNRSLFCHLRNAEYIPFLVYLVLDYCHIYVIHRLISRKLKMGGTKKESPKLSQLFLRGERWILSVRSVPVNSDSSLCCL